MMPDSPLQLPETLLARFAAQTLAPGYLVSTPRDPQNRILLLQRGKIRIYVASEDKELTLAYLVPGELFSTHTRAYLRTETQCEVLAMSTRDFAINMANEPGMLALIMPVLGRILDNSIAVIEDLAFRDVAGRLARFLLVAARQHGGHPIQPGAQVVLDLSIKEIALLLGTSRQTVSSLLSSLVRDGILGRPGRGRLVLLRPDILLRWQEGDTITKD